MPEPPQSTVGELMIRSPVTMAPGEPVIEATRRMAEHNIGAVLVVIGEELVGIFTERDVLRIHAESQIDWSNTPVGELMTTDVLTVAPADSWDSAMARMSERSVRHLPVVEDNRLVGVLSMRDLLQDHAAVLEALVEKRTAELRESNAQLTARDRERSHHLQVAGEVQRRLLPAHPPEFEPLRLALHFAPHDSVSGDYFDFIRHDADALSLLIADVSGHGVPAALVTVMAKTCHTAYCRELTSPAAVLQRLNEALDGLLTDQFLTMFVARFDRRTMELTYARAGHPPPLLIRGGETLVHPLEPDGVALGFLPDARYADERVVLRPGDRILFYTDGLSECRNAAGEVLGDHALGRILIEHRAEPAEAIAEAMVAAARAQCGDSGFGDDLTLLVVEVN